MKPIEDRFWSKVKFPLDPDDCWEWGAAKRNGYGVIGLGGRRDGIEYAHRWSYMSVHEFIADGMDICHLCNNRACVNPSHLYEGTRKDNMEQAARQGRVSVPNRWRPGQWNKVSIMRQRGEV